MILKSKGLQGVSVFLAALFYAYLAYFFNRVDFVELLMAYSLLFLVFVYWMQYSGLNFRQLVWLSIGLRLVFLFSWPALSQDFYRFIWDGRVWLAGISPYLYTPDEVMLHHPELIYQGQVLVDGMQSLSAGHYSNYPPVSQWLYALAALVSPQSLLGAVMVLRIAVIFADLGILYFGNKILQHLKLPSKSIFWFMLNPLIVLELTGNLHLEGVMLCFFLGGMYMLFMHFRVASAIFVGLSVATKLLSLIFLPVLLHFFTSHSASKRFSIANCFAYTVYVLLAIGVFVLSFWGLAELEWIAHFGSSLALWFGTFEFNASVYYLLRWLGYQVVGWNTIAYWGKILPALVLLFILYISFIKRFTAKTIFIPLLLAASFYLLMATTVHPWYLATPLLISLFTPYRFVVVWSWAVVLSYAAYHHETYQEHLGLVALEYGIAIGYVVYETFLLKKKPLL